MHTKKSFYLVRELMDVATEMPEINHEGDGENWR
jgi:hypothetical protein